MPSSRYHYAVITKETEINFIVKMEEVYWDSMQPVCVQLKPDIYNK